MKVCTGLFLSFPWPLFFLSCFDFYEFHGLCGCAGLRGGQIKFELKHQLYVMEFSGEKGEKVEKGQLSISPLLMDVSNFPVGWFKFGCYWNTMYRLGKGTSSYSLYLIM